MQRRILVVGDAMLDRYWEGRVDRISPEAPVPVLQVQRDFSRAGGAANVALNVVALGSRAALLTLIGDDDAGRQLAALLAGDSIELHGVGGSGHKTTQKIRCVALRHQLLRTDFEEPASAAAVDTLTAAYADVLPTGGVVVLSDYAKGALRDAPLLIERATARGNVVLVDPKGRDYTRYRGATLLKPNAKEVEAVVGDWHDEADFRARCAALRAELAVGWLLVTRGEEGMTLFDDGGDVHHLAADVRDVYDVSGAGDTVMATLAHCLARGASMREAVAWANRAAGIVVGKFGTASVTPAELALPASFGDDDAAEPARHALDVRAAGSTASPPATLQ